jgi:hypothetical protein
MPLQRPLWGVSVTCPIAATNLLSLIRAATPTAFYSQMQGSSQSWNVQLDPAATDDVYLGDENVSITNCGVHLKVGSGNPNAYNPGETMNGDAPIGSIYVCSAAGTSRLNIMVFGA